MQKIRKIQSASFYFTPNNQMELKAALQCYDPVAYFTDEPTIGDPEFASTHIGQIYYFVSAEHKAKFDLNPRRYLPQYDGFCAVTVSQGYKLSSDPTNFKIVDDKLYLFYRGSLGDAKPNWEEDEQNLQLKADTKWQQGNLSETEFEC